jgi:hypothetical protein
MKKAFGFLIFGIALMFIGANAPAQVKGGAGSHWHFNDNHWNYYDAADKAWYYTDGTYWFYNDGAAWAPYSFDKQFGREGFMRDGYKAPERGKYTAPTHKHK